MGSKKDVKDIFPSKKEEIDQVEGIIDGAEMVNVRKEPEVVANNQIAIAEKGTKVIVIDSKKPVIKNGIEWLKVRLKTQEKDDPDAYVMKKYIKIL